MKATDMLKKQHREVSALFKGVMATEDPDERMRLVGEIASELTMHATIEEELFYPAFRAAAETKKGQDQVLEAYEEHHVLKLLVAELPEVDASADNFEAKMTVLQEIVEHHVEEEEEEMFPAAERKLGKERLEQLAEEMQERVGEMQAEDGDMSAETSRATART